MSNPKLEEMAKTWLGPNWGDTELEELVALLEQVRREGAEARDREWCEAIEPDNSDTDLGRTIMTGGPQWTAGYLKEKLLLAESEGAAEVERLRDALVRQRDDPPQGEGCECDHSNEHCCVRAGIRCVPCEAAATLTPRLSTEEEK